MTKMKQPPKKKEICNIHFTVLYAFVHDKMYWPLTFNFRVVTAVQLMSLYIMIHPNQLVGKI